MKRIRTIIAILLIAAITLTGCKAGKETMFTVMEAAEEFEKYYFELSAVVESNISELEELELALLGATDGERVSLGFKADIEGAISMEVEELLIIDEDALYVNVAEVLDILEFVMGYDIGAEYGITSEWLEIPVSEDLLGMVDTKAYASIIRKVFEEGLAEYSVTGKEMEFEITVDELEDVIDFVEAFAEAIDNNKDDIVELVADFDGDTLINTHKEIFETLTDSIVSVLEDLSEEYGLSITSDDIEDVLEANRIPMEESEEALQEFVDDAEDMAEELLDSVSDTLAEFVETLEDEELEVSFTVADSMTGDEGEREYAFSFEMDAVREDDDEELLAVIEYVMTEDEDLEIDIPKKAATIEDIVYLIYNGYINDFFDSYSQNTTVEPQPQVTPTVEPETQVTPTVEPEPQGNSTAMDLVMVDTSGEYKVVTIDHVPAKEGFTVLPGSKSWVSLKYDAGVIQQAMDEETGVMYFEGISNPSDYTFIFVDDSYASFEDFLYVQLGDKDLSALIDLYELHVGNVIIVRFDVDFDDYYGSFFFISLGTGEAIYGGSTAFDPNQDDTKFDEFLAALFMEVGLK